MNKRKMEEYMGTSFRQNCGFDATITEYYGSNNVTVVFNNPEKSVRERVTVTNLLNGKVSPIYRGSPKGNAEAALNKYLGNKYPQKCGQNATVIGYKNFQKATVRLDDGTVKTVAMYRVLTGSLTPNTWQSTNRFIGKAKTQRNGMKAKYLGKTAEGGYTFLWEDGFVDERGFDRNFPHKWNRGELSRVRYCK